MKYDLCNPETWAAIGFCCITFVVIAYVLAFALAPYLEYGWGR